MDKLELIQEDQRKKVLEMILESGVKLEDLTILFEKWTQNPSFTAGIADASFYLSNEISALSLQTFSKNPIFPAFWALYFFPLGSLQKNGNDVYSFSLGMNDINFLDTAESKRNYLVLTRHTNIFHIYIMKMRILSSLSGHEAERVKLKKVRFSSIPNDLDMYSYVAGLIEAGIGSFQRKTIIISSSRPGLIDMLHSKFNSSEPSKTGRALSQTYRIIINQEATKDIIAKIIPYLYLRKHEAIEIQQRIDQGDKRKGKKS